MNQQINSEERILHESNLYHRNYMIVYT